MGAATERRKLEVKNCLFLSAKIELRIIWGFGEGMAANRRTVGPAKPCFRRHCLQVNSSFDKRGATLRHNGRVGLREAIAIGKLERECLPEEKKERKVSGAFKMGCMTYPDVAPSTDRQSETRNLVNSIGKSRESESDCSTQNEDSEHSD